MLFEFDYTFSIGGNDGTMCMSSGERLNLRKNAWEPITAMHSRRYTIYFVTF